MGGIKILQGVKASKIAFTYYDKQQQAQILNIFQQLTQPAV